MPFSTLLRATDVGESFAPIDAECASPNCCEQMLADPVSNEEDAEAVVAERLSEGAVDLSSVDWSQDSIVFVYSRGYCPTLGSKLRVNQAFDNNGELSIHAKVHRPKSGGDVVSRPYNVIRVPWQGDSAVVE